MVYIMFLWSAGDRWGHLVAARSRLEHLGTLESCHACAADNSAPGREKMGKEPTCTESKCSKSQRALLDDLDRLVAVAGAHLAHRSDFGRGSPRGFCGGSASYSASFSQADEIIGLDQHSKRQGSRRENSTTTLLRRGLV